MRKNLRRFASFSARTVTGNSYSTFKTCQNHVVSIKKAIKSIHYEGNRAPSGQPYADPVHILQG
jgi:hypothetical protein